MAGNSALSAKAARGEVRFPGAPSALASQAPGGRGTEYLPSRWATASNEDKTKSEKTALASLALDRLMAATEGSQV